MVSLLRTPWRSPTGDKPYPLHRGNLLLSYISPSTWGNQRRARSHYHLSRIKQISGAVVGDSKAQQKIGPVNRQISGAVAGDSNLQDRGFAHYLLPLLFSLVS